jgi:hypothetical protein
MTDNPPQTPEQTEADDEALIGAIDRLAAALERIAEFAEKQKQPLRKGSA